MTHPYIPNTEADRRAMLAAIGRSSVSDLFVDIPAEHRDPELTLPPMLTESELMDDLRALAGQNRHAGELACFLGAGAYRHYVPSVVNHIQGRSEFWTAYTPYQPEISQGTLQTIFEFQSMVCELTGMDVANAGMYDGASALAEACLMAVRVTGRRRIALSLDVHPTYRATVRTYALSSGFAVDEVKSADPALTEDHACYAVQRPDFFGTVIDGAAAMDAAHATGALGIAVVDPVSLALYAEPGRWGADIVVGEAASIGNELSFGGPYVGMFACREQYIRQMPGRIAGRTVDVDGRTAYVLTLQAREQHIRRERATSNICTSTQLIALRTTIALAALGPQGLRKMAELCYQKAHYAAREIAKLPGYSLPREGDFYQEFVVTAPRAGPETLSELLEAGIIGGYDVSDRYPNGLLVCVTDMNSREQIDRLVAELGRIGGGA
jgi:glycine dehydrogenase subunit 1